MDWLASAIAEEQKLPNDSVLMEAASSVSNSSRIEYPDYAKSIVTPPARGAESLAPFGLISRVNALREVFHHNTPHSIKVKEFNDFRTVAYRTIDAKTKLQQEDLQYLKAGSPLLQKSFPRVFSEKDYPIVFSWLDACEKVELAAANYLSSLRKLRDALGKPPGSSGDYSIDYLRSREPALRLPIAKTERYKRELLDSLSVIGFTPAPKGTKPTKNPI